MNEALREQLGRIVREVWVAWAATRPYPKPHWLDPWEAMPEYLKEVDRQIGAAVVLWAVGPGRVAVCQSWLDANNPRRAALIGKKINGSPLTDAEAAELNCLQEEVGVVVNLMHPGPWRLRGRLAAIQARHDEDTANA